MKEIKNINMTGKEYLDILKYKDDRIDKFWTKENKIVMTILGVTSIISLMIVVIVNIMTPNVVSTFAYTWEGIVMFLAICLGISWLAHGVGFVLVKR